MRPAVRTVLTATRGDAQAGACSAVPGKRNTSPEDIDHALGERGVCVVAFFDSAPLIFDGRISTA